MSEKIGLCAIFKKPKISEVESLAEAGHYVALLKSRVAKDNAIRFFIKKFGWYI